MLGLIQEHIGLSIGEPLQSTLRYLRKLTVPLVGEPAGISAYASCLTID